jgi:hypothetical protein
MTIGSNSRNDYIGDGATATYDYGFKIFAATDLRVTVSDLDDVQTELDSPDDFSVTGVGNREGGTITLLAGALESGYKLTIRRVRPLTQTTDFRNQAGFYAEVHEAAFDHVVMITQQLADEISRSLRFPETDASDGTLPGIEERSGQVLGFDPDTGAPIAVSIVGVPVTPFAEDVLLDATDAAAWREALEIPTILDLKTSFGAVGDGVADDRLSLQAMLDSDVATLLGDGTYLISAGVTMTKPSRLSGNGAPRSIIRASAAFPASTILTLSPTVGSDPRGWMVTDLRLANVGAAAYGITVDLTTVNKYMSKLTIRNVIFDALADKAILLINPVNIDGWFTSVIEDCWSLNGYYLERIGDSVIIRRNTISGTGRALYINAVPGAANISIAENNITAIGGSILIAAGQNIYVDNNQIETPAGHNGTDFAVITVNNAGASLVVNPRLTRNNISSGLTANLIGVYLNYCIGAEVDGNTITVDAATAEHIYIEANATDTYIGQNVYLGAGGAVVDPVIVDGGVGTMGIWKNATLATWVTNVSAFGPPVGFFKTRDGLVHFRGALGGAASTVNQVLFTLPVGFRPKFYVLLTTYALGGTDSQTVVRVLPTGEVQIVSAGTTSVYLDGLSFSTR